MRLGKTTLIVSSMSDKIIVVNLENGDLGWLHPNDIVIPIAAEVTC